MFVLSQTKHTHYINSTAILVDPLRAIKGYTSGNALDFYIQLDC